MKTPIATFKRVEKDGQAELRLVKVFDTSRYGLNNKYIVEKIDITRNNGHMTVKQISKELNKSEQTITRMISGGQIKGELVGFRHGQKWIVKEEDFDKYLLKRVTDLPKWYYKCTYQNPEPVDKDDILLARTHEVCIKNVLPVVTPEEYKLMCKRSKERNNV